MLVSIIFIVAALVFALIVPVITLKRYYTPSDYSILQNLFWAIVTIVTWPLVPFVMASRRRDKQLLVAYAVSLVVFILTCVYLVWDNYDQIMQLPANLNV